MRNALANSRTSAKILESGDKTGNFELEQGRIGRTYYVSGTVQGVGYRYFAQRVSIRLGLAGYAKNLSDGRVEVYAIGEQEQLLALKKELKRGPKAASVAEVAEQEAEVEEKYSHGFTIEHSF